MKRLPGMLWPVLLLALLATLAWLQYRWTGQISVAERERMQASLQSSVRRFAGDVDDELARIFETFRVERNEELATRLAERWNRYRDEARYPELVESVYVADADERALSKLAESGELVPVEWPPALVKVREQMGHRRRPPRGLPLTTGEVDAVVIPIASRERRWLRFAIDGLTIVTLDRAMLRKSIFPDLAERHFGADYGVAVVDGDGDVVFATPEGNVAVEQADAHGALFGFASSRPRFVRRPPPRGPEHRRASSDRDRTSRRGGPPTWEVFVRHRAGSLEAAVGRARTRNLAVSFGILGLLAASIGLVAVSTRRATELNDRKMEFVAGVSHELRTPVAVLRSAGQNLSDGSVSDPDQVKRYGALIETEGRRLDDLVEQVLELAGIQSHKRRFRREPVLVASLVADALRDCESLRTERGVPVTTSLPPEGATVIGDPDALRRALGNIIVNAIKHGGDDNAIEVSAESRGETVAIEVADRGPGIAEKEQAHVFDAFYRGRRAQERQVAGSGLGLSLVENIVRAHRGHVTVESTPGRGSRFTVSIPAATRD